MESKQLLNYIQTHRLGVLSTINSEQTPESALVGIAISPEFEIVFDTLDSSRKCKNLRLNPNISFVVGWDETAGRTIQLEGIADEPKGEDLEKLKRTYFGVFPDGIERLKWPGITYFRVIPKWIRYSDFLTLPSPTILEFSETEIQKMRN